MVKQNKFISKILSIVLSLSMVFGVNIPIVYANEPNEHTVTIRWTEGPMGNITEQTVTLTKQVGDSVTLNYRDYIPEYYEEPEYNAKWGVVCEDDAAFNAIYQAHESTDWLFEDTITFTMPDDDVFVSVVPGEYKSYGITLKYYISDNENSEYIDTLESHFDGYPYGITLNNCYPVHVGYFLNQDKYPVFSNNPTSGEQLDYWFDHFETNLSSEDNLNLAQNGNPYDAGTISWTQPAHEIEITAVYVPRTFNVTVTAGDDSTTYSDLTFGKIQNIGYPEIAGKTFDHWASDEGITVRENNGQYYFQIGDNLQINDSTHPILTQSNFDITAVYTDGQSSNTNTNNNAEHTIYVSYTTELGNSVFYDIATVTKQTGDAVTINTAEFVPENKTFMCWIGFMDGGLVPNDSVTSDDSVTFTMPDGDVYLSMLCAEGNNIPSQVEYYYCSITVGDEASLSPTQEGSTVYLNAAVPNGSTFGGWTSTSEDVVFANASSASTTFTMPNHDVAIVGNINTPVSDVPPIGGAYDIIVTNGTAYVEGNAINSIAVGSPYTITLVANDPAEGYTFSHWTGTNVTFGDTAATVTTISVSGNATITANYREVVPHSSTDPVNPSKEEPKETTIQTVTPYVESVQTVSNNTVMYASDKFVFKANPITGKTKVIPVWYEDISDVQDVIATIKSNPAAINNLSSSEDITVSQVVTTENETKTMVETEGNVALSKEFIDTLAANPDVVFHYIATWKGVKYDLYISGDSIAIFQNVDWYGVEFLNALYGKNGIMGTYHRFAKQ